MADATSTIEALTAARGRGTTLVSLLVPAAAQLALARQHVEREFGLAGCIKSRATRTEVLDALKAARTSLRAVRQSASTGYAVYAGWVTAAGGAHEFV